MKEDLCGRHIVEAIGSWQTVTMHCFPACEESGQLVPAYGEPGSKSSVLIIKKFMSWGANIFNGDYYLQ